MVVASSRPGRLSDPLTQLGCQRQCQTNARVASTTTCVTPCCLTFAMRSHESKGRGRQVVVTELRAIYQGNNEKEKVSSQPGICTAKSKKLPPRFSNITNSPVPDDCLLQLLSSTRPLTGGIVEPA